MRAFVSKLSAQLSNAVTPVLAIAGAGLLSYGAYLIYHPAAFIVGGVLILLAAWDSSN